VVKVSQPILYSVFDFASLVFSLLPNRLAVATVKFIRVESQKGANQDRKNYYDCRSHRISGFAANDESRDEAASIRLSGRACDQSFGL
jgi:hypothetical protein